MPNLPLTWEDVEADRLAHGPALPPPSVPEKMFDWSNFWERLETLAGYATRIIEAGPSAIEGSKLKMLIERGKKAVTTSPSGTAPAPQADSKPEATQDAQYTPGTAFLGLYEVAKYLAASLPTLTVGQAIEALSGVGVNLPPDLLEKTKGIADRQLNTLLLFGLPMYQKDIQAYLAKLPELDPSHVVAKVEDTANGTSG